MSLKYFPSFLISMMRRTFLLKKFGLSPAINAKWNIYSVNFYDFEPNNIKFLFLLISRELNAGAHSSQAVKHKINSIVWKEKEKQQKLSQLSPNNRWRHLFQFTNLLWFTLVRCVDLIAPSICVAFFGSDCDEDMRTEKIFEFSQSRSCEVWREL